MTLDEAKIRVERIDSLKSDDERATIEEVEIYEDFIQHVANSGDAELAAIAEEILKSSEIKFRRTR